MLRLTPHQRKTLFTVFPKLRKAWTSHDLDDVTCRAIANYILLASKKRAIRFTVHVRGGVAYASTSSVRIIDHDNH